MVIAAVNLVLVFVLFSANHQPGRRDAELPLLLVPMAVGAFPFLTTAALLVWTLLGAKTVDRLAMVCGIGLPFILLFGFWIGLAASAQELPPGSPGETALTIYQFTLLSAVFADGVTLIVAVVARARGH